jgi:hypothetical protein
MERSHERRTRVPPTDDRQVRRGSMRKDRHRKLSVSPSRNPDVFKNARASSLEKERRNDRQARWHEEDHPGKRVPQRCVISLHAWLPMRTIAFVHDKIQLSISRNTQDNSPIQLYIFHSNAVRTDISFFSLHKCACMGENRGHNCTQSTLTAPLMSQDVSGARESQNGCYDCAIASYSCWLDNILKVFLRSNCPIKQPCSVTICAPAGTSMESCRGARPTSLRQVRAHSPARRFLTSHTPAVLSIEPPGPEHSC